jgi:Tfp pilus assembly protein PilF
MPFNHPDFPNSSERVNAVPRLVGWKEIAAYLGKTDRTVKRWGKHRGLPIHRVPGVTKTSVYAYTAELDWWLESVSATEPAVDDSNVPASAVPVPAIEPQPPNLYLGTSDTAWSSRRKWAMVLSMVFVSGIAVNAATHLAAGVPAINLLRRLFPASVSVSGSTRPLAVSEAEKREAQNFYVRGRYEWNQRTPDSLNRALDNFTQAIVHDPSDAKSYVGLAETYDLLREYSTMPDKDAYSRGVAAARRAVELDDSLAEAHRALAFAEMYGSWNFTGAEWEFRRAIELNPKDAEARRWYANAIGVSGRFAESLDQMEKAVALDPTSPATLADKGMMLHEAGRTDEGVELLQEVERSSPEFRSPHDYLMRISLERRDYPAFLAEGEKTAESMNDPVLRDIVRTARTGYARNGEHGLLLGLYVKQKEHYSAGKLAATTLAETCVLMGKKQEALHLLEEAFAHHEPEVLACLSHPNLLTLKNEPRYRELVRKINFPGVSFEIAPNSQAGIVNRPTHAAAVGPS